MDNRKIIQITLLSLMVVVGVFFIASAPSRVANKSLAKAEISLATGEENLLSVKKLFEETSRWYKESYTSSTAKLLEDSESLHEEAASQIDLAKGEAKPKNKKNRAFDAEICLKHSRDILEKVSNMISALQQEAISAQNHFITVQKQKRSVIESYGNVSAHLEKEAGKYLSKYETKNAEELAKAKSDLEKATKKIEETSLILPPSESAEKVGDPQRAIRLLTETSVVLTEAEKAIERAETDLKFCAEAQTKAKSTFAELKESFQSSLDHLQSIVNQGPLTKDKALKASFALTEETQSLIEEAFIALVTPVENNKCDLPLSYSKSLRGLSLSKQAVADADNQVDLYKRARQKEEELYSLIKELDNGIERSQPYRNKLNLHAKENWKGVENNLSLASNNCSKAREFLASAKFERLQNQKFETALNQIEQGIEQIVAGKNLLRTLSSISDQLEAHRSNWPRAETEAKQALSDNQSLIIKYGKYSSSAKSDFEEAKNLLTTAQTKAQEKYFAIALSKATEAKILASDSGSKAKKAYKKHQDEAAAALLEAMNNLSSSSSGSDSSSGWGGGGSSSSGGGSSSSGGGWSGGSSSSDGGGWSGGSSSSDGGGW